MVRAHLALTLTLTLTLTLGLAPTLTLTLALTVGTLTGLSSVYEDYLEKTAASAEAHGSYCGSGGMEGQGVGESFQALAMKARRKTGAVTRLVEQRAPEPSPDPSSCRRTSARCNGGLPRREGRA